VRVTVVLDELGPQRADLYFDANRDRVIDSSERIGGDGKVWRTTLQAAIVEDGKTAHEPRGLIFRLGETGRTLSCAALGFLEGEVRLDGKNVRARRVDGDSNAAMTDPQDRIWVDLDQSGEWDPLSEQFLHAPTLTLGSKRYVVRTDSFGKRLSLEELTGEGFISLKTTWSAKTQITAWNTTLIGRDGLAVGFSALDRPQPVPVGEYRVGTLAFSLADTETGRTWHYIFSDSSSNRTRHWYTLAKDQKLVIDPIGKLDFVLEGSNKPVVLGEDISLSPRLYTEDGLLINTCEQGEQRGIVAYNPEAAPHAKVRLLSSNGQELGQYVSGFA
jgi:hypothetical protein